MKKLQKHFHQSVGLEAFADSEGAALDHVATAYAVGETLDGYDRQVLEDQLKMCKSDVSSLESLLQALQDERDVGLESGSAKFAQLTLESIQNRHGIDINELTHTAMPSLECFQGRLARTATSLTVDSVRNTIGVLNATVEMLQEHLSTETN